MKLVLLYEDAVRYSSIIADQDNCLLFEALLGGGEYAWFTGKLAAATFLIGQHSAVSAGSRVFGESNDGTRMARACPTSAFGKAL